MTKEKKQIRFLMILLLLTVLAAGTADIAFSEPVARTDILISDSIAPMKLEIDSNTKNTTEIKTVTLTNTGETATEYVCYIEQTGGKKEQRADLKLSESKITLRPGDSRKLEIEIPIQELKTNPVGEEYKLKIIRNPETQTPVGYIIPIKLKETESGQEQENKIGQNNKTAGKKGGAGTGLAASGLEKETEKTEIGEKNKNDDNRNNHPANAETEEKRNENRNENGKENEKENKKANEDDANKKIGVLLLLLSFMFFASAAGIYILKFKK